MKAVLKQGDKVILASLETQIDKLQQAGYDYLGGVWITSAAVNIFSGENYELHLESGRSVEIRIQNVSVGSSHGKSLTHVEYRVTNEITER